MPLDPFSEGSELREWKEKALFWSWGKQQSLVTSSREASNSQYPFEWWPHEQEQRAVVKSCLHWNDFCRAFSGKGGEGAPRQPPPPIGGQDVSCNSSPQLSWAASGYGHTFTLWGQSGCWWCAPHHPSHLPDHGKMELPCLPLLLTPGSSCLSLHLCD